VPPSAPARASSGPIRRLGTMDHLGGPQRVKPFGLVGGRGRRDYSGAQEPSELQREDRDTSRALRQDGVTGGRPKMVRQCDPGGGAQGKVAASSCSNCSNKASRFR
jgi:hypothetical protein